MTVMTKEQIEALLNNDPGVLGQIARDALNTALALHQQLADAEAAQALVVERAADMIEDNVRHAKERGREIWAMPDLRALAPASGVEALAALRADFKSREMEWAAIRDEVVSERDDLRARLAAAEAQVGALRAERDALETAREMLGGFWAERAALARAAPDTAAIRGALLSLPAVYAHQINTGVRDVYDPLQRFYRMEDVLRALIPKRTADDRA